MHKHSIAINTILNTIKTIMGIVFPLITFPYVSRILGVDNLGIYNFSSSFIEYFLLLASLGISTYAIREGASYRDDLVRLNSFVSEVFSINILSTFFSYTILIIALFTNSFLEKYETVILLLSAEIFFTTIGVSWLCNVFEDFLFITIRSLAFQLVSLILTFTFVNNPSDLTNYVLIVVFANTGSNILNFIYIRKYYCHFKFTFNIDWQKHLKPILTIFSTAIAITIYVNSDITMLGFLTNDFQVGLYSTAVKIYTVAKNILWGMLFVLIPRFSFLFSKNNTVEINELFMKALHGLNLIVLPSCIFIFLFSRDIVYIISGKAFLDSALALRILSIALIFSLYASVLMHCILIPAKEENNVFKSTFTSAIANVFLNVFFIPMWGINGAAVSTVLAEALVCFLFYKDASKYVTLDIKKYGGIKKFLIVLFGCTGIIVVGLVSNNFSNLFFRIVFSIGFSVFVYALILLIMKEDMVIDLIIDLKRRVYKK